MGSLWPQQLCMWGGVSGCGHSCCTGWWALAGSGSPADQGYSTDGVSVCRIWWMLLWEALVRVNALLGRCFCWGLYLGSVAVKNQTSSNNTGKTSKQSENTSSSSKLHSLLSLLSSCVAEPRAAPWLMLVPLGTVKWIHDIWQSHHEKACMGGGVISGVVTSDLLRWSQFVIQH